MRPQERKENLPQRTLKSLKRLIKPLMNTNKHEKLIWELVSISVNSWLKSPSVYSVVNYI